MIMYAGTARGTSQMPSTKLCAFSTTGWILVATGVILCGLGRICVMCATDKCHTEFACLGRGDGLQIMVRLPFAGFHHQFAHPGASP